MSGCAHLNPPDVIRMAEEWLLARGIAKEQWPGMKIRHAENTPGAMWESIVIEIERRGAEWIVTKLDRRPTAASEPEGLSVVS